MSKESSEYLKDWKWDLETGNFVKRDKEDKAPQVDMAGTVYVERDSKGSVGYVPIPAEALLKHTHVSSAGAGEPPVAKAQVTSVACPKCGGRPSFSITPDKTVLLCCSTDAVSDSLEGAIKTWNNNVRLLNLEREANGWKRFHDCPVLVRPGERALKRDVTVTTMWWPSGGDPGSAVYDSYRQACSTRLTNYRLMGPREWGEFSGKTFAEKAEATLHLRTENVVAFNKMVLAIEQQTDHESDPPNTCFDFTKHEHRFEKCPHCGKAPNLTGEYLGSRVKLPRLYAECCGQVTAGTVDKLVEGWNAYAESENNRMMGEGNNQLHRWYKAMEVMDEQYHDSAKALRNAGRRTGELFKGLSELAEPPWNLDSIEREFAIAFHVDSADEIRIPADVALHLLDNPMAIGSSPTILSKEELEDIRFRALTIKEQHDHRTKKYHADRTTHDGTLLVSVALVSTTKDVLGS